MSMPIPPADPAAGGQPLAPAPAAPAPAAPAPQPAPPAAPAPQNPPVPQPPTWTPPPAVPSPPPAATQQPPGDDRDVTRLPQWAQKEIADQRSENARRRVSERTALVSMHAFAAASALGINSQALFDSTAFTNLAAELDPNAADFNDQLRTKLTAIMQSSPWLAAQPAPIPPPTPAVSGGEFGGSPGEGQPITEEQLSRMTPEQIAKAYEAGKLSHLM